MWHLCIEYNNTLVNEDVFAAIAGLFQFLWGLFRSTVLSIAMDVALGITGKVLEQVTAFLQSSGFLQKKGGWVSDN